MPNNAITLDAGFNRLQRLMANVVPETRNKVLELTQDSGENWVKTTRENALVDTGAYKRSIHFETVKGGFGALFISDVSYWAILEFGTGGLVEVGEWGELAAQYKGQGIRKVNLPAHPNLIPAYMAERERYVKGIKAAIRNILR